MSRRKRTRIATGIYEDAFGIAIVISDHGTPREFRHDDEKPPKPYKGHTRDWLIKERKRRQNVADLQADRKEATDALFPADVDRFLDTISSPGHRRNTQGYMKHWSAHFKEKPRNAITDLEAQTAYAAIRQADSTRIHLRRALIQFYEALNGKSGYNPGRSLKKPPKPEEPIRDLPWADIEKLFTAMQPSKARARLKLIAYIGLPQKQIKKLHPNDLRLDRRELIAHPRRKGAGVTGQVQPLSDFGIMALQEFQQADAFGTFQNQQLVNAFRSAATRAGVTLPSWAVPYSLRHSFLTEVARGGADIEQIAQLGMHATLEQSARYIKGAASARATKAITSVPRFSATTKGPNLPIRSSSVARRQTKQPAKPARKRAQKRKKSRGKL